MLRSLPSDIDDALDTLYESNAIFGQFLGSASMTCFFFFSSLSLPLLPFLVLSFLSFLAFFFPSLSFFVFFVSISSLFFLFLYRLFFSLFLSLSCVCVVIDTTCNIYVVVFLGWQAVL